ncbi:2211_t:CDS:2 [Paraglomus occultum]|uniref:2211_t:CDS:1 n=1 Tax=Paraglomus occultum TaxID=144539 RepID=A0A9N9F394_9GLOM|nr:2211_t:CDS:2 [Paraglomus occultum]
MSIAIANTKEEEYRFYFYWDCHLLAHSGKVFALINHVNDEQVLKNQKNRDLAWQIIKTPIYIHNCLITAVLSMIVFGAIIKFTLDRLTRLLTLAKPESFEDLHARVKKLSIPNSIDAILMEIEVTRKNIRAPSCC